VTEAVGTELIGGVTLTAGAAIVALLTAAALVAIGVFAGYPIATAFTVTGAVVGVGLAMGGDPAWPKYTEILTLWILTPFVGGGVAYGVARMLIGERLPERALTAALAGLVGAIVANVGFALLGPAGQQASLSEAFGSGLGIGAIGTPLVTVAVAAVVALAVYADLGRDRGAPSADSSSRWADWSRSRPAARRSGSRSARSSRSSAMSGSRCGRCSSAAAWDSSSDRGPARRG